MREVLRTALQWRSPTSVPELHRGEAHVWRTDLDRASEPCDGLLVTDERARAARFCFDQDRRRWARARSRLRWLLGRYLGRAPGSLRFATGPHGKPSLCEEACGSRLEFNVSHSAGRALFAFARERRVGVDIERIRPELATDGMAVAAFSRHERAELARVPRAQLEVAFFNGWTRKEAFVKATGDGIGYGLDAFDVTLAPDAVPRLLATRPTPGDASAWRLHALDPFAGFAAALACEVGCRRILCFDLDAACTGQATLEEEPWKTRTRARATAWS